MISDRVSKEEIIKLYLNENKTIEEVIKILNISKTSFLKLKKEYGLFKLDKENIKEAVNKIDNYYLLYSLYILDGLSQTDISNKFNLSRDTISRLLNKNNIKKSAEDIKKSILKKTKKDTKPKINKDNKKTNMKKYGVMFPLQSKEIREKALKTNIQKYGCENPLSSKKVQEKVKETNFAKHGVLYPMQSDEIKKKAKLNYFKKHGVYTRSQLGKDPEAVIAFSGSKDDIIKYLKDHALAGKTTSFIAKYTGYNIIKIQRIRKKYGLSEYIVERSSVSEPEDEISKLIKEKTKLDIVRNSYMLNGKQIDIYIPKYKIGIEYNGCFWHCLNGINEKITKNYHLNKTILSKAKGITLIHIFSNEWNNNKQVIEDYLLEMLGLKKFDFDSIEKSNIIYSNNSKPLDKFYIQSGFELIGNTLPDYIWWRSDEDWMSRVEASGISDQYLENEGYHKVYDCGQSIWRKKGKVIAK